MTLRSFFQAGIGLTGAVLLLLAGVGHAADADPVPAPHLLRICAEYAVSGPDWQPDEDDLTTEAAADLMRSVTADRRDLIVYGFADTYDGIGAERTPCELVHADYLLRAWIHRGADRSYRVTTELQAPGSPDVMSATSESGEKNRMAALLAQSVAKLLDDKLHREHGTKLIEHFGEYSLGRHHLELARSRMLRLLGRRYGEPQETAIFERSEAYLEEAVRSRERDGKDASFPEMIETLASSFRSLNLTRQEDDQFLKHGKQWIARAEEIAPLHHPEVAVWRGIYGVFSRQPELGPFDLAVDDGPDDQGVPTREGRPRADAYLMRGLYYEQNLKNHEAARRDFLQAVKLNSTMLRASSYLVLLASDLDAAREEWNRIRNKIRSYGLATYQLARRTWESGDPRGALSLIDEELIGRTDDAFYDGDAYVLKARIQTELNHWDDAERTLIDGLRRIAAWTEPSPDESVPGGVSAIVEIIGEYADAIDRGSRKRRFSRIQSDLTALLLGREDTTALEQSLLALAAARAGDKGTAVEIAASLEHQFPQTPAASDRMLHIAIARIYELLRRENSAVVVQSAVLIDRY